MSIPVTNGSGQSSVAAEAVGGLQYQQIEVLGKGGASVMAVNPDGSINVSVLGTINVSGSVIAAGNQSVSGTVGASVIGWVPVQTSNTSVISYVPNSVAAVIIGGSIAATFTPPANQSVSGTVQTDVRGSVATVIIGGSIAASFTPPANQSVSGTVGASIVGQLPGGTAVLGSVAALQGTNPWIVTSSIAGGLFPISGSVAATVTNTNLNVGGSVVAFQGTSPFVVNFQNSSIIGINAGSVVAVVPGSVITVWKDSSVLAVPVGSTIAVLQAASIVGTYAEDAAAVSGDKGVFMLGVRNDTLSSVTSADGDYSPIAVGPSGENIVANSPLTKWVQGTADFRNGNAGASIVIIAAQGASVFSYITGVQIANMGPASVLVTLAGTGSTLAYSIAPAGGGSNIYYPNALKTPANGTFAASISGIASVLVSAQGFISKT